VSSICDFYSFDVVLAQYPDLSSIQCTWNMHWRRSRNFSLTCSCNSLFSSTLFCLPAREEG
jgi:hypothetical protein